MYPSIGEDYETTHRKVKAPPTLKIMRELRRLVGEPLILYTFFLGQRTIIHE